MMLLTFLPSSFFVLTHSPLPPFFLLPPSFTFIPFSLPFNPPSFLPSLPPFLPPSPYHLTPMHSHILSLHPTFTDHTLVRLSGLKSLCSVVKTSGPVLPRSVAVAISHLPLDCLSPSLPAKDTLQLLELLLACVTSGNSALALPLSTAIQIFTENSLSSTDQQVSLC